MQKPVVALTFDVERDYLRSGYVTPVSFSGIEHNLPTLLDKLKQFKARATFFLTPEVFQACESLTREIRKAHSLGLHTHSYYHPEFRGWENDGDSFRNYSVQEKERMIMRDIESFEERFGKVGIFRIARLEPDPVILRVVSREGVELDSSFHNNNYGLIQKVKTRFDYHFKEIPVNFHLFGLTPQHFAHRMCSVVLTHPSVPHGKLDEQVYDEEKLWSIMRALESQFDFVGLEELARDL